jgi:hypothetical protein
MTMHVDGHMTFLLSAQGHTKSSSVEVQALVCPSTAKIYIGWEVLISLGVINATFPEPASMEPPSALYPSHHEPRKCTPKCASGVVQGPQQVIAAQTHLPNIPSSEDSISKC